MTSPDLPLLQAVGHSLAVADAHPQVRRAAACVTRLPGGAGAVREVCDLLLASAAAGARGALAVTYRLLGIFALVALIVGAFVLSGGQRESAAQVTVEEAMPDPGYSARKAHMVRDRSGRASAVHPGCGTGPAAARPGDGDAAAGALRVP